MPAFLEALGCRATFINVEPGGAFARPSEPTAENLGRLCRTVRRSGSEVGLAQDADADRLAVIDESGQALGEDLTLALAVKHVLGRTPGPVVVNLSASRAIDDLARAAGVPVYRTRIGETNVVEEMLARGAVIGGEGNGGVIWPRVHPCRDSFAAAGLVLQAMAESGRAVSELRREIPFYAMVRDKIPGTQEDAPRLLGALRRAHRREVISTLDGLKMRFGEDAWAHVRPSNTEPIIRLQVEAATRRRAGALMARLKREIAALP